MYIYIYRERERYTSRRPRPPVGWQSITWDGARHPIKNSKINKIRKRRFKKRKENQKEGKCQQYMFCCMFLIREIFRVAIMILTILS